MSTYECTCVICSKRFTDHEPYDVCSLECERKRLKRNGDKNRYIPKRDNKTVKPRRI